MAAHGACHVEVQPSRLLLRDLVRSLSESLLGTSCEMPCHLEVLVEPN